MEERERIFDTLIESAEEFGKTSLELLKYKAIDKATFIASTIALNIGVMFIAVLFIITLSIGLSILIGEAVNSMSFGFLIMAAFYALCAISFYFFFGASIKRLVTNIILKQIFK